MKSSASEPGLTVVYPAVVKQPDLENLKCKFLRRKNVLQPSPCNRILEREAISVGRCGLMRLRFLDNPLDLLWIHVSTLFI